MSTIDEIMDEQGRVELALVDFRIMPLGSQHDFLASVMDDYVALAERGKIDKRLAEQVFRRAAQAFDYTNHPLGKIRSVSNGQA